MYFSGWCTLPLLAVVGRCGSIRSPIDVFRDGTLKNKLIRRILVSAGPYTTPRAVIHYMSGRNRPTTARVIEVMSRLHQEGIGTYLERGGAAGAKVFIKLPVHEIAPMLDQFNVSLAYYESRYKQTVPPMSHGVVSLVNQFRGGQCEPLYAKTLQELIHSCWKLPAKKQYLIKLFVV